MNKLKLMQALQEIAEALESGKIDDYNWSSPLHCNCGQLVRRLLKISVDDLREMRKVNTYFAATLTSPHWAEYVLENPQKPIIVALAEHGLTCRDLAHLEHLTNPTVLLRDSFLAMERRSTPLTMAPKLGLSVETTPFWVARYMRAWAKNLEEELALSV